MVEAASGNSFSEKKLIAICTLISAMVSSALTFAFNVYQNETDYSVEKAKYFKGLLGELTDKEKANLALLSMWQLFSREDERKTIVLAGVQTGNTDIIATMSALGDELKPYKVHLEVAAKSSNSEIAASANSLLNTIDWETRTAFHANTIINDEKDGIYASLGTPSYAGLTAILEKVPEAQELFRQEYRKQIQKSAIFANLVHENLNDPDPLKSWLTKNISSPQAFADYAQLLASIAGPTATGEVQSRINTLAFAYVDCFIAEQCDRRGVTAIDAALFILSENLKMSKEDKERLERMAADPALKQLGLDHGDIQLTLLSIENNKQQ